MKNTSTKLEQPLKNVVAYLRRDTMYNGPVLYIEYQNGDTQVVEGSSVHRIVKQVKKHLGE